MGEVELVEKSPDALDAGSDHEVDHGAEEELEVR